MTFSVDDDERQFAAGVNIDDDDCQCPAFAAGFGEATPYGTMLSSGEHGTMAYQYDRVIEEMTGQEIAGTPGDGIRIDEETAREAWLTALERFDTDTATYEAGVEVADELGWL